MISSRCNILLSIKNDTPQAFLCFADGFLSLLEFRVESPGYCLISTASTLEWLQVPPVPSLTGEQHGMTEPKYPEGGHCQSLLLPQRLINVPLFCLNSVETATAFNVVSHPHCSEPRNLYLERFRSLSGIELVTLSTSCRVHSRYTTGVHCV